MRSYVITPQVQVTLAAVTVAAFVPCSSRAGAGRRRSREAWGRAA